MAKCLEGLDYVLISKAGETGTIVMQVSYPHIVGQVVLIDQRNADEIEPLMRSLANGDVLAKVAGYSIFVLPGGTLDWVQTESEKTKATLKQMAEYLLSDVIVEHEDRFKKYREGYVVKRMSKQECARQKEIRLARRAARIAQEEE